MADPKKRTFDAGEITISVNGIELSGYAGGARVDVAAPTRAGANDARKIECKKSKHHGFYPQNEACQMCDPAPAPAPAPAPKPLSGSWIFPRPAMAPPPATCRSALPSQCVTPYLDGLAGALLDSQAAAWHVSVKRAPGESDEIFRWHIKDELGYTIRP